MQLTGEMMPNIAEFRTMSSSGALLYIASATINVYNKLPWPVIGISFVAHQNNGKIDYQNKQYSTYLEIMPLSVVIDYQGIPIASGSSSYAGYISPQGHTIEIKALFSEHAIAFIEGKRLDDIQLMVHINLAFREMAVQGNNVGPIENFLGSVSFPLSYSEKKWIKFLSDLGYSDKWVVELDRPKIEGFYEVLEHLDKASDALYNKKEPEDVLRDLRAARDALKPYIQLNRDKIDELIDVGSPGESGKKKKSERINNLVEVMGDFLNIGPHNDKYKVTYTDALLAYREFVSILSYLSSIMVQINR